MTRVFRILFRKPIGFQPVLQTIVFWGCVWNDVPEWMRYCHVEIWTSGRHGIFELYDRGKLYYCGDCYTSTTTGKEDGCVVRHAPSVLHYPQEWDYCEVRTTEKKYQEMMKWLSYRVSHNKGYDLLTILSFAWLWRFGHAGKFICSGHADGAVDIGYKETPFSSPSPIGLANWLDDEGLAFYTLILRKRLNDVKKKIEKS